MSFRLEYKRGSTAPAMFQRQVIYHDLYHYTRYLREIMILKYLLCGKYFQPSTFQVRMQVDLSQVSKSEAPNECLYAITFTLISGRCQIVSRPCQKLIKYLYFILFQVTFEDSAGSASIFRAWCALHDVFRPRLHVRSGELRRETRWARAVLVAPTRRSVSPTDWRLCRHVVVRWVTFTCIFVNLMFLVNLCFSCFQLFIVSLQSFN